MPQQVLQYYMSIQQDKVCYHCQPGSTNRVMTSPYGINWTIITAASNDEWRDVTFGNGLFVAVATSGTGKRVIE